MVINKILYLSTTQRFFLPKLLKRIVIRLFLLRVYSTSLMFNLKTKLK